jgi:protein-S-isoprenylcysteine O-methyltransferase Ste14
MAEATADPGLIRAVALLAPVAATAGLWWWRAPDRRLAAAVLLATVWNLPALLVLHLAALHFGWWHYDAVGGTVLGMPVDLLLGWMLLWGAIPVLAFPHAPLLVPAAVLLLIDLALMPLAEPVVALGESWLVGEAVGLLVALLPAILLGRWTAADRNLGLRAVQQVVLAGTLLLWVLPLLATGASAGVWSHLAAHPPAAAWLLTVGLLALALPGVSAVQEFAERGGGTPLPWDPPSRLVRSGPYAYINNPMQTSVSLLLLSMAAVSGTPQMAAAAVVTLAYGAGLEWWHEREELAARWGSYWLAYHEAVPAWRPTWRPNPIIPRGTLWVAGSCEQCAPIAPFFTRRQPVRLTVRPAEEHPRRQLRRITYESANYRCQGVAAIARAFDHLQLGWAVIGWAIRLPVVCGTIQMLVDAAGGGPRDVPQVTSVQAPASGHAAACGQQRG